MGGDWMIFKRNPLTEQAFLFNLLPGGEAGTHHKLPGFSMGVIGCGNGVSVIYVLMEMMVLCREHWANF